MVLDLKTFFGRLSSPKYREYLLFRFMPASLYPEYLCKIYEKHLSRPLNLNNPQSLTEKIQWLKLYDTTPLKCEFADSLKARENVKNIIPELNFPEIYSVADSVYNINFESLPECFVLNLNNGFGKTAEVIHKTRLLSNPAFKSKLLPIQQKLEINYAFVSGFELQYKNIKPKIYAEEFHLKSNGIKYPEYRFMCLNGTPVYCEYCNYLPQSDPNSNEPYETELIFMDLNWVRMNLSLGDSLLKIPGMPPVNFAKMTEYSKVLSKDFKLVRIDFSEIDGKVYFRKLTFTPCSGFMQYSPYEYDYILGEKLNIG